MRSRPKWLWALGFWLFGCAGGTAVTRGGTVSTTGTAQRARGPNLVQPVAAPIGATDREVGPTFATLVAKYADLDYPGLVDKLALKRAPGGPPNFDPTRVDYYDRVRTALQLTSEEEDIYRRTGIVGVDHTQIYSMASAYYGIYTGDLPVLVTTDSILHAMHRSFDNILMEVEKSFLLPKLGQVLEQAHRKLEVDPACVPGAALRQSCGDVDLYLTVARNLLAGAGAPPNAPPTVGCFMRGDPACADDWDGTIRISSVFGSDAAAVEVLKIATSLQIVEDMKLYGGRGTVDFSQFLARGHYTKDRDLSRYFRAMMWLGRVDVGFHLAEPDPYTKIGIDLPREQRDAALLSSVVASSKQLDALGKMSAAIDFLVGSSDNVTVADLVTVLGRAQIKQVSDLAQAPVLARFQTALKKAGIRGQQIRSQVVYSSTEGTRQTPLPDVFQMFGQRFVLDSFILSKVVFDSILYRGEKQMRMMPSGLDVMAALGNDEAVSLLAPELERDHYSANLLAARGVVETLSPSSWNASLYNVWLSALSLLDDVPPEWRFPSVMRSMAWQRKQLQTQLASWAELRHDTILYAKQSYTAVSVCEYPTGYVEPYPDFFARIALFAEEAKPRLAAAFDMPERMGQFLDRFASVAHKLEALSRKELAGTPFDSEERSFVKKTIDVRGGGSGPPRYDGWYPGIIYGSPATWEPTVADVHTDPGNHRVLEVATGNVGYVVVAVDNEQNRAAYVGPIYSYYEFGSGERLTDEAWQERVQKGQVPSRPEWTKAFQAAPKKRTLASPTR